LNPWAPLPWKPGRAGQREEEDGAFIDEEHGRPGPLQLIYDTAPMGLACLSRDRRYRQINRRPAMSVDWR